jgi:predicted nucleic acid-binding protein
LRGWLLDTNVIASLIAADGAPSVKKWARAVDERDLFISILTLAEYDKGIANLPAGDSRVPRYLAARDALESRFSGRVLSLEGPIVRRWGMISGRVKRETGHAPPVVNTLLAATAIEADLYLVSRNVKDLTNSGAAVFDPWRADPVRFPLAGRSEK